MATNYPTALDTTTTHPADSGVGATLATFPHDDLHGNANDAIRAIETELGLNPSGTYSTVKDRLDSLEGTWTAVTKVNSWANVASSEPLRYRKVGDEVRLYGSISSGTTTTVGTLPTGFRPASTTTVVAGADNPVSASDDLGPFLVSVNSSGVIATNTTNRTLHVHMTFEAV